MDSTAPFLTPVRGRVSRKVAVVCGACGKPFAAYRYDVERRGRSFCSVACQAARRMSERPPREEIEGLYRAGVSTNGLASHYGVSKGTIYNWLKQLGIATRTNGEGVTLAQTGVSHTEEHNAAISRAHIARGSWQGRDHPNIRDPERSVPRSYGGKRATLGGIYVRSTWEHNYALYLNLLRDHGEIERWEYEPDTFEFPVKRGNRFYTPDFKVFNLDGSVEYHEVKGYMDAGSRTRIARMATHYPEVKLVVIDRDAYNAIKKWRALLPDWEVARPPSKGGPR